jgi:hypothetical protein
LYIRRCRRPLALLLLRSFRRATVELVRSSSEVELSADQVLAQTRFDPPRRSRAHRRDGADVSVAIGAAGRDVAFVSER